MRKTSLMKTSPRKISQTETRVTGPTTKEKTMIKGSNPRIAVSDIVTEAVHTSTHSESSE